MDREPNLLTPPRAVRPRRTWRALRVLLPALLVLLPVGSVLVAMHEAEELQHLVDEGVIAKANVERLRSERRRRSANRYYVDFAFDAGGRLVSGTGQLPESSWHLLRTGQVVDVSYWPPDPTVHRLGKVTTSDVDEAMLDGWLVGGVLAVVVGGLLGLLERTLRRNLALLRDGRVLVGEVESYERARSRKQKDKLTFVIVAPGSGTELRGVERPGKRIAPEPRPGSEILVLQLPADPSRFATLRSVLAYAELAP